MRIAFAYGKFSTGPNGPFDVAKIYQDKGLTGSESFFFNTVKGLAELGHTVIAYFHCAERTDSAPTLAGAAVRPIEELESVREWGADVIYSWNEPDLFRRCPQEPLRICVQQLNDFTYCHPGYKDFVDLWAIPSEVHRQYLISIGGIPAENSMVVSNCLNEEFYEGAVERDPHRIVYCSSPDRGLHWLLEMFPKIRKQVPQATLKVYYKVDPWIANTKGIWYQGGMQRLGNRARYVQESLGRLGKNGEKGVTLVGPISNVAMAKELMAARVLAYPCDTIRFTEGFSVSILDACAAGCVPVISDCDAIGSVYKDVAHIIPGLPADNREEWVRTLVSVLSGDSKWNGVITRAKAYTKKFTRQLRAAQWEKIIRSCKKTAVVA